MSRFVRASGWLLLLATLARAQPQSIDPPVVGRPDGFSNIVGKYRISVRAEPVQVQVEDPITLSVRIQGAGPKAFEPNRRYLRLFPDSWERDFYIEELRDEHKVVPEEKAWVFVFRLRPRHAKVQEIDGIKLVYYDPELPGERKFVTRYAERNIELTVKPKTDVPSTIEIKDSSAPESFFEIASGAEIAASVGEPSRHGAVVLGLLLVLPPVVCLAAMIAYRRLYPDAWTRARRLRIESSQRALAQLQEGQAAWVILARYLRERFDFPALDATPAEVAAFLKRQGFAKALCEQARAFFQACDAVRYTAHGKASPLHDDASRLVEALEADPCARR